jgi:hypothetical protein
MSLFQEDDNPLLIAGVIALIVVSLFIVTLF